VRSLQHRSIAQRELDLIKLCKYVGEFLFDEISFKRDYDYQLNELTLGMLISTLSHEQQAENGQTLLMA
jgi:hypothetical protein